MITEEGNWKKITNVRELKEILEFLPDSTEIRYDVRLIQEIPEVMEGEFDTKLNLQFKERKDF